MSWCYKNLRDCKAWLDEGLPLTTTSNEAAKLFDCLMRQYITWTDSGMEETRKSLWESHPQFLMGNILNCGLTAVGTAKSALNDSGFKKDCDDLKMSAVTFGNKREQLHAEAVYAFAYGNLNQATRYWENLLEKYPNDILAAKFLHDTYFYLGDKVRLERTAANAIKANRESDPCFSFLYGMHAFGLEECGNYVDSEKEARQGLSLEAGDAWATHAVAHCMEMTGRFEDGIKFMEATVKCWEPSGMLACHNFWHLALYYLEKGDYESALTYYDSEISKRSRSGQPLDIVDAASLLLRLEMEGVGLGDRWDALIGVIEPRIYDHTLAFNEAHYRMVLESCPERKLTDKHRQSIEQFLGWKKARKLCLSKIVRVVNCANFSANESAETCQVMKEFGQSICESISKYNGGNFDEVVELLFPIRHDIYQIGGSEAQRDIFTQLLIHSAINGKNLSSAQKGWLVLLIFFIICHATFILQVFFIVNLRI
ncbi:unnamed protein product [Enterobius vermicularis]|uniref:Tetratricopeptide repeat protein 38 n=1 Tax=Enterobius vermicularis TaxID=51028 RepID=A0A0N4VDG7_ENTVE|nr:unnamed protein product [Enterobius vermicularis]